MGSEPGTFLIADENSAVKLEAQTPGVIDGLTSIPLPADSSYTVQYKVDASGYLILKVAGPSGGYSEYSYDQFYAKCDAKDGSWNGWQYKGNVVTNTTYLDVENDSRTFTALFTTTVKKAVAVYDEKTDKDVPKAIFDYNTEAEILKKYQDMPMQDVTDSDGGDK